MSCHALTLHCCKLLLLLRCETALAHHPAHRVIQKRNISIADDAITLTVNVIHYRQSLLYSFFYLLTLLNSLWLTNLNTTLFKFNFNLRSNNILRNHNIIPPYV